MCARKSDFVLLPGRLWPNAPSGSPLEIEVFGATGEYKSGKTLLGLSIAPGKHPEGHKFAGRPRTLYLDFEKSGGTYGGTGCLRVDFPAEMLKLRGGKYTPKDTAEVFLKLVSGVKVFESLDPVLPGMFDVILGDPITDVESGIVDIVKGNPAEHGYTKNQFDNSTGLLMGAVKAFWKQVLLKLSNVCRTFYFTSHLRDEFVGNKPSGKREPKGKESLLEVASLYVWLERKPDTNGKVPEVPSTRMILKDRLADTLIDADGSLKVIPLLPPSLSPCTVQAIRGYIANPPDYTKLRESERQETDVFSDEEKLRLEVAKAEAERDAVTGKLALIDKQVQLSAVRAAAQPPAAQNADQTARMQADAEVKRKALADEAAKAEVEAQEKLHAAEEAGHKLLEQAEGDHATARDVAQEVQEAKTQSASADGHCTKEEARACLDLCRQLNLGEDKVKEILGRAKVARFSELSRADCRALTERLKVAIAKRNIGSGGAAAGN